METHAVPPVLKSFTQHLACLLTSTEKIEKGKALADVLADIRSEESRADMLKQSLKSAMASLESRRDELSLIVARGEELREVDCEDRADMVNLSVFRVRIDTGQIINTRPMTPEERQQSLDLTSPS